MAAKKSTGVYERQNDDGTWSFTAQIRLKGLLPTSRTFNHASRREAEKAALVWRETQQRELLELRDRGGVRADVATLEFAGLVEEYLDDPDTRKLATVDELEKILEWWTERYGTVKALEFPDPLRLREARKQLLSKFKPARVNRYLAAARACVNFGRAAALLPAHKVVWPPRMMLKEPKGRERYLTGEELKRALEAARAEGAVYHAAVMFAVGVGCRQSEQLRVRWCDIDAGTQTVAISVTKTSGTSRRAHLPPAVARALEALRVSSNVRPLPACPVFTDGDGAAIKAHVLIDAWQRIRKAAGLSDVRWHDLRHSAASFLIQGRATLAEVGNQLGHKSTQTTARYTHLVPGHKPAGADSLNEKLGG